MDVPGNSQILSFSRYSSMTACNIVSIGNFGGPLQRLIRGERMGRRGAFEAKVCMVPGWQVGWNHDIISSNTAEKEELAIPQTPWKCQTRENNISPKNQRMESKLNKEQWNSNISIQDKTEDGQDMQKLFLDHINYTESTNDTLRLTAQIYVDFPSNTSLTILSLPVILSFTLLM